MSQNEQGLGKKQREVLAFIRELNGEWHGFTSDVRGAVHSLAMRNLVEVSGSQFRALYPVQCDRCEILSINGVACHEHGCPNMGSRWDRESQSWIKQRRCFECGCTVDAEDLCCSEPVEYEEFEDMEVSQ